MKGVVRKRLLAILSAAGLAGTVVPASGQVLKGADQAPDSKTESKIKANKSKQEKNATADVVNEKRSKTVQNNHGISADDKRKKDNLSAEAGNVKTTKGHTEQKVSTQHKIFKVSSEHNSAKAEALAKDPKAAGATQGEAPKTDKTTPK